MLKYHEFSALNVQLGKIYALIADRSSSLSVSTSETDKVSKLPPSFVLNVVNASITWAFGSYNEEQPG